MLFQVTPRLQELQFFRLQQESKNVASSTDLKGDSTKKNKGEKRKSVSDAPNEESPAKRQKDAPGNQKDKPRSKTSVRANKVADTVAPKDMPPGEDDTQTKDPTPEKSKQYNDQCTAFVSNLNLKVFFSYICS